ncbi:hypothetical protein [Nocardioides sp. MH1]|uniref:hypothetical protein n=1 Tax=Nocardioides sp. MH1 TaxID=3242490 RepID=UPI003520FD13
MDHLADQSSVEAERRFPRRFLLAVPGAGAAAAVGAAAPAGGNPAERMRVQPNGKVGIGVNDPLAPLDVKGVPTGGGVVRAVSTSAAQAGAFRGVASSGSGFGGWFTGRGGGLWAEGVGADGQGLYATGDYGVRTVATKVGVMSTGPTGVIAVGRVRHNGTAIDG